MPRKRKLAERARDYCSRTMVCRSAEKWVYAWVERAWIAGFRAGSGEALSAVQRKVVKADD